MMRREKRLSDTTYTFIKLLQVEEVMILWSKSTVIQQINASKTTTTA